MAGDLAASPGRLRCTSTHRSALDIHDLISRFQNQVMRESFPSGKVIPGDRTESKLKEGPPLTQPAVPLRPPVGILPVHPAPGTPLRLPPRTGLKPLGDDDYQEAAQSLGVKKLMLRAFAKVEGKNHGFDQSKYIPVEAPGPHHTDMCMGPNAAGLMSEAGSRPRLILLFNVNSGHGPDNTLSYVLGWNPESKTYKVDQPTSDWLIRQRQSETIAGVRKLLAQRP